MENPIQEQPTVPSRISVWAYPWDLADEGVETSLDWLRNHHFDAIELCSNYHAISTFSPRNTHRSQFYSEQGGVYFPANNARYGRIKPFLHDDDKVLDVYRQVSEAVKPREMQLNAWVIGMFQPWIARNYPDTASTNAFGHRSFATTCPAHPDIHEYLPALLLDLCSQFNISGLILERVGYPEFTYGWVRPRILIRMDPWTRFLAGLCFNEHSMSAARAHGVDPEAVQARVADEIRENLASPTNSEEDVADLPTIVEERCVIDEDLRGYLESREHSASGLVKAVRHALRRSNVRVGVSGASLGWPSDGLRLRDLLPSLGSLMIPDPTDDPITAKAQIEVVRQANQNIEITVNQTAHYQVDPHGAGFETRARRLAEIEPDRVMVYNFGLVTPATLAHTGAVLHNHLE
jgi:hypothetical protein